MIDNIINLMKKAGETVAKSVFVFVILFSYLFYLLISIIIAGPILIVTGFLELLFWPIETVHGPLKSFNRALIGYWENGLEFLRIPIFGN